MWYRFNTVVDPGEGPGGAPPLPLFLDQTEAVRIEKKIFLETAPSLLSQVLDDRPKTSPSPPPPPLLSEGLDRPLKHHGVIC